MFGFHKNMHSPGFSFGTNDVARRYLEKLMRETGGKFKQIAVGKRLEPIDQLKYTEREEYLGLRGKILARERVLAKLKAGLQANSSRKGYISAGVSPIAAFRPDLTPSALNKSAIIRPNPAIDSPTRDNTHSQGGIFRLSPGRESPTGLPKVKPMPFTRQNPKKHEGNPLTGEGFAALRSRDSPSKSARPFALLERISDFSK